jgi:hypothetical protein
MTAETMAARPVRARTLRVELAAEGFSLSQLDFYRWLVTHRRHPEFPDGGDSLGLLSHIGREQARHVR